jgi:NAD(P)-dependent dehydrogenase (short-subunit alcohol dehydrogenase family)
VLIQNAAISNTNKKPGQSVEEYSKTTRPLLRATPGARIVNVSSGVGSLTATSDPAYPYRAIFGPVYPASKTALNALTVAMALELEPEGIKVNAVSPGYTKTNLNGYSGTATVEEGAREAVRVALLGPDGPTCKFTRWENETIGW